MKWGGGREEGRKASERARVCERERARERKGCKGACVKERERLKILIEVSESISVSAARINGLTRSVS